MFDKEGASAPFLLPDIVFEPYIYLYLPHFFVDETFIDCR